MTLNKSNRLLLTYLLVEEDQDDVMFTTIASFHERMNNKASAMYRQRANEGFFSTLINKHLQNDDKKFREFFRLSVPAQFNYVLGLVKDDLKKHSTNCVQYPITPDEKLALTLRFLATGESFRSLAFAFKITPSYISKLVSATLDILRAKLIPLFLPDLSLKERQARVDEFETRWKFPNCMGAIDSKHVRVFCPKRSGSLYYNYKHFYSIVLLAVVDANYRFMYVDIGSYGKEGDSGILEKSNIGNKIASGNLLPPPRKLPNSDTVLPCVIVGDEAFRLQTHLMKPFSRLSAVKNERKAMYNYRLCLARRVSENAFGLLSQVFRVSYTPINVLPETTDKIIIVACCLHNLLRSAYLEANDQPHYSYDPEEHHQESAFTPIRAVGGFGNYEGFQVRDTFAEYFNSNNGSVSWQLSHVQRRDRVE